MFDPSYRWPNLFKEADDMVQASLVLYLFADLRRLAREQVTKMMIQSSRRFVTLPPRLLQR